MIQGLRNAWRLPDVRNKLIFTAFILIVYQFAAHIPVIGVNRQALADVFTSEGAGFANVLNLLSGGAVQNFSILANGVYPYITASIIFQLLTPIIPQLEAIQREPVDKRKSNAIPTLQLSQWQFYSQFLKLLYSRSWAAMPSFRALVAIYC